MNKNTIPCGFIVLKVQTYVMLLSENFWNNINNIEHYIQGSDYIISHLIITVSYF